MTDYKFADIVLESFPFTDQTATKKCHALIVSSNECNQKRKILSSWPSPAKVIAPVTLAMSASRIGSRLDF